MVIWNFFFPSIYRYLCRELGRWHEFVHLPFKLAVTSSKNDAIIVWMTDLSSWLNEIGRNFNLYVNCWWLMTGHIPSWSILGELPYASIEVKTFCTQTFDLPTVYSSSSKVFTAWKFFKNDLLRLRKFRQSNQSQRMAVWIKKFLQIVANLLRKPFMNGPIFQYASSLYAFQKGKTPFNADIG